MVADCSFRIEVLLLLNVPAFRSRVWLTLKVLSVTSSIPASPRVSPPANESVPPVEVIEPESSCKALESVRLADLVSIAEPVAVIARGFGRVRPALSSASVSLFPLNSSVPKLSGVLLVTSVSPLNLKVVFVPVVKSFKLIEPPLDSRVPELRSSVPCQPLQFEPEFAVKVPVMFKAPPSLSSESLMSNLPVAPTVPPSIRFRIPPPCTSSPFSVKAPLS